MNKWADLGEVSRFRGALFMTNINVPTVGLLTKAPGFGVCSPDSIAADGGILLKHCQISFMRRYDYWDFQRPQYFYYFTEPSLFPGFAACMPTGTIVGTERGGASCMQELLDRLSRSYRLKAANSIVRVFDLERPLH
jgi:hypothetical protein